MRKLIRLANAAEFLGVRTPTLREWYVKRKNLDFVKAGRAVCVTEESIERFIAENTRFRVTSPAPVQPPSLDALRDPKVNESVGGKTYRGCRAQRATAVLAFSQEQL
jgi:excisionase family DNA binding protein